jgi:hypothetical protein
MAASGLHHLMGNRGPRLDWQSVLTVRGADNQLLGDSFYRQFEVPLMEYVTISRYIAPLRELTPFSSEYDTHKLRVAERQAQYEKATQAKAKLIRETESRNVKLGKKKLRGSSLSLYSKRILWTMRRTDLSSFRRALAELQAHVNDLDNLKIEHYSEVYEYEQEMWDLIASKVGLCLVCSSVTDYAGSYRQPK